MVKSCKLLLCVCQELWPSQNHNCKHKCTNPRPIMHARALISCLCFNFLSYQPFCWSQRSIKNYRFDILAYKSHILWHSRNSYTTNMFIFPDGLLKFQFWNLVFVAERKNAETKLLWTVIVCSQTSLAVAAINKGCNDDDGNQSGLLNHVRVRITIWMSENSLKYLAWRNISNWIRKTVELRKLCRQKHVEKDMNTGINITNLFSSLHIYHFVMLSLKFNREKSENKEKQILVGLTPFYPRYHVVTKFCQPKTN